MVEQPVNGVEKIVFVERVYSDIYYAQCNARNETIMMVVYGQAKTLSRDGLLHQFQYTKLFVKDSSHLLAIQNGGATRQWCRKNSFR